jgi:SOS-response transcriptional repressor LexA
MLLTERQQRLYDTIAAAARSGVVCPTNRAIAAASGMVSASAVADALGRLQRKGKVRVERYNRARVVHLPELGLATAQPAVASAMGLEPHWRLRLPGQGLTRERVPQRLALFAPPAPWRLRPEPLTWRPSSCQYIAGEPSADDRVKCGRPLAPFSAYCVEHHRLCHRPVPAELS